MRDNRIDMEIDLIGLRKGLSSRGKENVRELGI
jgi:hypothetical protein